MSAGYSQLKEDPRQWVAEVNLATSRVTLIRSLRRFGLSQADAEDAIQIVLLELLHRPSLDLARLGSQELRAYIARAAKNRGRDLRREQARRHRRHERYVS